jgi:hypothetical protein
LKELEEVIEYKKAISQDKKNNYYKCWINRTKSIPHTDLEAHQMTLNIRCLVLEKKEEVESFVYFAKCAQEANNPKLCERILFSMRKELVNA